MATNTLKPDVEKIIQEAIHSELWTAHLYRYLAVRMQRIGYFGAAKWFEKESADELEHYKRHAEYLNNRGSVAQAPPLGAVTDEVPTLRSAIELAYETELILMNDYNAWAITCSATDRVTDQHLHQYLAIQQTSVGEYGDWLARIDRVGTDPCGLLIIDKELGEAA